MKSRKTSRPSILPSLFRFMVVAGLLVGLTCYGVGGWYFSDVLKADLLDVAPSTAGPYVRVTAATADTVALDSTEDPTAAHVGTYGLSWDGGAGLMGETSDSVGSIVVREFVPLFGDALRSGDLVDVDPWVWPSDPEQGLGLAFEVVSFDTPLGAMDAWEIGGDSDEWMIAVHGKGAERREALRIGAVGHRLGMSVLLIDYRNDVGAPQDPTGFYQYGLTEWQDLEGAVQYALDNGGRRIVLVGLSSGAAISLSFLYESSLADAIDRVVFDSPNIDLEQTVRLGADQRELPVFGLPIPDSLATVAMWVAEVRFDVDFDAWNYIARLGELGSVPILTIHGDRDSTIPLQVSVDLATARPDLVTMEVFEGAEHMASWNVDSDRYETVVTEFLLESDG